MLSIFEQAGTEVVRQGNVASVFHDTGLDWQVEQRPVYSQVGMYPNIQRIPKMMANYRSDNGQFLGIVHEKIYQVVQNLDAFNFIDQLPNFSFEKVGTFSGGKKVFVVGKANEQIDIDGSGDLVNFYLTFLHGHDGKSGIRFVICPIRLFCMNQLNLMLESASFKYNITHTGDVQFKLAQIQRAIANSKTYVQSLETQIKAYMTEKPNITAEVFIDRLIDFTDNDSKIQISRKEATKAAILDLYQNKDDLQNYKGSSFGMLSAVADYISHKMPDRNAKNDGTINNTFVKNIEGHPLLEKARRILQLAA